MKCGQCVFCRKYENGDEYWCRLAEEDDTFDTNEDPNAWLARDCVRDEERRKKLKQQMEG